MTIWDFRMRHPANPTQKLCWKASLSPRSSPQIPAGNGFKVGNFFNWCRESPGIERTLLHQMYSAGFYWAPPVCWALSWCWDARNEQAHSPCSRFSRSRHLLHTCKYVIGQIVRRRKRKRVQGKESGCWPLIWCHSMGRSNSVHLWGGASRAAS